MFIIPPDFGFGFWAESSDVRACLFASWPVMSIASRLNGRHGKKERTNLIAEVAFIYIKKISFFFLATNPNRMETKRSFINFPESITSMRPQDAWHVCLRVLVRACNSAGRSKVTLFNEIKMGFILNTIQHNKRMGNGKCFADNLTQSSCMCVVCACACGWMDARVCVCVCGRNFISG